MAFGKLSKALLFKVPYSSVTISLTAAAKQMKEAEVVKKVFLFFF